MVSIAWKLSTIEEWTKERSCLFWRVDYINLGHKPKSAVGSSLDEVIGCRDLFLVFNYTCQMIRH